MADRDGPTERIVFQRLRNRAIESLDLHAQGDAGVRLTGNAEYVNQFFDTVDDAAPWHWREWPTLTAKEVRALDLVQRALLDACTGTPAECSDDDFIASGWPSRIQAAAGPALALLSTRGRFHEEREQTEPSAAQ
jgi:hypothetical protein